jgi:hypothetical protein
VGIFPLRKPARCRRYKFLTEVSSPPAFSFLQAFAASAAAWAEPAWPLPEEECAAVDARRREDSAEERVEPQADDHSLLAAESDEPSLQVVDWSPDDSAPARDDWPEERERVYWVEPQVAD